MTDGNNDMKETDEQQTSGAPEELRCVGADETYSDKRITAKRLVGFWHYGVILTYIALVLGVVSLSFSAMGKTGIAVVLLMAAGLCDAFDGLVAKSRKNRSSADRSFGIQIDSLSDVINFGVAPIMIGLSLGLKSWYFIIIYVLFVLCALVRLGYYNVRETEKMYDGDTSRSKAFEGMPVTNISLVMPLFYMAATMAAATLDAHYGSIAVQCIMAFLYVVYAALMVIRFRMPKPRVRNLIIIICCFSAVMVAMFCVRWFVVGIHSL